ncbi:hypothetical protein KKF34_06705 [Myxococcota bacterium]|nr:hypothetical protein [Myxococcota bacterium]MBU1381093.1 hypothetical protein [Myxococcota bacterium]MBU1496550.1 hypothetical protein [Myxococcota bacterium]
MDKERLFIFQRLGPQRIIDLLSSHFSDNRIERFRKSIESRITRIHIVVEKLYDPLNGNAVIRTAEALGIHHVHFIVPNDEYDLSRKVTMGAEKWVISHHHSSSAEAMAWFKNEGIKSFGALPPENHETSENIQLGRVKSMNIYDIKPDFPIALWFGNEKYGLSEDTIAQMDGAFYIPLSGLSTSLNLSVSAGISIAHFVRIYQLNQIEPDLHEDTRTDLLATYLLEDTRDPEALFRNILARRGEHL